MFPGSPLYRASNWVAESSTISSVPKDAVYIHLRINKYLLSGFIITRRTGADNKRKRVME